MFRRVVYIWLLPSVFLILISVNAIPAYKFCIYDETKDFIGRAGFALSHSSKFDVIVEYFLVNKNYNVIELNEVLFAFDQPLIGA